jgi:hypothetical protein
MDTIYEETDTEVEADVIEDPGNLKKLELLRQEIAHIISLNLQPSEGWYDERYTYIDTYLKLDWQGMMSRFKNKDEYIHATAKFIISYLEELEDERGTKPNFNLHTYHKVIHDIYNLWYYYSQVYLGNETDEDVIDLIEGMKFL